MSIFFDETDFSESSYDKEKKFSNQFQSSPRGVVFQKNAVKYCTIELLSITENKTEKDISKS